MMSSQQQRAYFSVRTDGNPVYHVMTKMVAKLERIRFPERTIPFPASLLRFSLRYFTIIKHLY